MLRSTSTRGTMRYNSFQEFWPFYVKEHSKAATRMFHFIGTSLGLLLLVFSCLTRQWYLLPLTLVVSYGFAWYSHFFIEHNRPATFKYPIYSFLADLRMYQLMLQRKMDAEVEHITKMYTKV